MTIVARATALVTAIAVSGVALTGFALPAEAASVAAAKSRTFANCTEMHKVYPHGVGRKGAHDKVKGHTKKVTNFRVDTALYKANAKSDRDHDGVACEKA